MKIIIGSDHRGYDFKEAIKNKFDVYEWIDVGTDSADKRVDYPVFAKKACEILGPDRGILICGSGVGISIAANRFPGIYAALCWSPDVARAAREHDNANVLVLPSDFIDVPEAISIVEVWIQTEFLGGRYQDRLDMIDG